MKNFYGPMAVLCLLGALSGCDNNTLLMDRVLEGDVGGVEAAILSTDDINTRNNYGWTALTHAARLGNTELMRLLIENGADVNAVDDTSWSPLLRAAMKGYPDAVKLLLENGADIHHTDNNGWTALHWAAQSDSGKSMRMLIDYGADLNAITDDGWNPRMVAQNEGNAELTNMINRWMKEEGVGSPLDRPIQRKNND